MDEQTRRALILLLLGNGRDGAHSGRGRGGFSGRGRGGFSGRGRGGFSGRGRGGTGSRREIRRTGRGRKQLLYVGGQPHISVIYPSPTLMFTPQTYNGYSPPQPDVNQFELQQQQYIQQPVIQQKVQPVVQQVQQPVVQQVQQPVVEQLVEEQQVVQQPANTPQNL